MNLRYNNMCWGGLEGPKCDGSVGIHVVTALQLRAEVSLSPSLTHKSLRPCIIVFLLPLSSNLMLCHCVYCHFSTGFTAVININTGAAQTCWAVLHMFDTCNV